MPVLFLISAFVIIGAVWFFAPLLRRPAAHLPVLFIQKTGPAPARTKDKKDWLSAQKLEKLFQGIQKRGFTPLLPSQTAKAAPHKGLMLVFGGGYETFYTVVFPLLKKYSLSASVILPAAQIGQYDAWQKPQTGPWQNILTKEEIKELHKSGIVEFISTTTEGTPLDDQCEESAVWQLVENKHRLSAQYNIKTSCVYCPPPHLPRPGVRCAIAQHFALSITFQTGDNLLPLDTGKALKIWPVSAKTFLQRLLWKIG